jgi:Holliday junction resolvase
MPTKYDANHSAIVKAFEACGCAVLNLAGVGGGCPDLAVSRNNVTVLVEVKTDTGSLELSQIHFDNEWKGLIYLVRDTDGVHFVVNDMLILSRVGHYDNKAAAS